MVEYFCCSDDGTVMDVTSIESAHVRFAIEKDGVEHDAQLDRDSVAAVVGQLTSWLQRTAKE